MSRAPVIEFYGSSFPVWIFSAVAGVLVALLIRQIVILLDVPLPWAGLLYASIAVIAGVGLQFLWLGVYGG